MKDNKCTMKTCVISALKSPLNWILVILALVIWRVTGMRYLANQDFDMIIFQQNYIMLLSLVLILASLVNHAKETAKLGLVGSITLILSFLTVITNKVGMIYFSYMILSPITLFLFLLQIKYVCCLGCQKCISLVEECSTDIKEAKGTTKK